MKLVFISNLHPGDGQTFENGGYRKVSATLKTVTVVVSRA